MATEHFLFELLPRLVGIYWKDWPIDMEVKALSPANQNNFSMSGTCPHCNRPSVFIKVAGPHEEPSPDGGGWSYLWAVMECQGCKKYILGGVRKNQQSYVYEKHYPLGKPNDEAPTEIPENVRADFREALRCRFVDAYNGTVEMCRRAVQASCIERKAPDEKLIHQIDWLAEQGIITTPLKEMAHRVRLGGNLGAHPPEDPDDATAILIGPEYADAVIEFTRDFFQHVYVMPERLKKFTFKKSIP
jgi:hypothetical protein